MSVQQYSLSWRHTGRIVLISDNSRRISLWYLSTAEVFSNMIQLFFLGRENSKNLADKMFKISVQKISLLQFKTLTKTFLFVTKKKLMVTLWTGSRASKIFPCFIWSKQRTVNRIYQVTFSECLFILNTRQTVEASIGLHKLNLAVRDMKIILFAFDRPSKTSSQ